MDRFKEITSTEKLLDIIRKGKVGQRQETVTPPDNAIRSFEHEPPDDPETGKTVSRGPSRIFSFHKTANVGVDIGHHFLRMASVAKEANGVWRLLDYRCSPMPPSSPRGTKEFSEWLKSEISTFCRSIKKPLIWALMSSANVDIRHIRIPKVPNKQIENAVLWTVKKDAPYNWEAVHSEAETVFDFEVLGEVMDQGIAKIAVMLYTAPRTEVEELSRLFSGIGFPLTGITVASFAFQSILKSRCMATAEETSASLFIGNEFSRIDIYAQDKLVMTRDIKAGIKSMMELLYEEIGSEKFMSRQESGAGEPFSAEQSLRKILNSLSRDGQPLKEGDPGFGMKEDEIFNIIQPSLERLVRQVERTFEHYTVTLKNERIHRIYVTSAMNVYQPMVEYIGSQLGVAYSIPAPDSQRDMRCDIGIDYPLSERTAMMMALGLALSDNSFTPNMIFTYKEKEKSSRITFINRIIFAFFIASVTICSGIFMYDLYSLSQKKTALFKLENQLSQMQPRVDQAIMQQLFQRSKAISERYMPVALLSEVSTLTPSNIRLTSLKAGFIKTNTEQKPAEAMPKEATEAIGEGIAIEGLISGSNKSDIEKSLTDYVARLGASPMFPKVAIQKSNYEQINNKDFLYFMILIKTG